MKDRDTIACAIFVTAATAQLTKDGFSSDERRVARGALSFAEAFVEVRGERRATAPALSAADVLDRLENLAASSRGPEGRPAALSVLDEVDRWIADLRREIGAAS